jgi:hypothetical protein
VRVRHQCGLWDDRPLLIATNPQGIGVGATAQSHNSASLPRFVIYDAFVVGHRLPGAPPQVRANVITGGITETVNEL